MGVVQLDQLVPNPLDVMANAVDTRSIALLAGREDPLQAFTTRTQRLLADAEGRSLLLSPDSIIDPDWIQHATEMLKIR